MLKSIRNILLTFLFIIIFYIMKELSSILLPLAFALVASILFQPLIRYLKKIKTPRWLILPVVSIASLAIIFGFVNIFIEIGSNFAEQKDFLMDRLRFRLDSFLDWAGNYYNFQMDTQQLFTELKNNVTAPWISETAGGIAAGIGSFTGSFLLFSLYYVLLLAGMSNYKTFLNYVGGDENQSILKNYEKIQRSVFQYMIVKTLISIATGLLAYFACIIFGIKFAFLWAFITFILNYIPSIGSTIATIPPVLMGIIQFDSVQNTLLLLIILASIQLAMGNVVEPKLQGNTLKLNTLTVIFGLVFWGFIWGVPGMMLSVPLLVIIKLIFEHFESLRLFARLMGSSKDSFIVADTE